MTKSSTVTAREQPVPASTSASGALVVQSETFTVGTDTRFQFVDLTERVMAFVQGLKVSEGIVNLFSMHTTCSVLLNESQVALQADIKQFLEQIVQRDAEWLHNDPSHSDCDRLNADAHLRALLLGQSLTLQVSGGELVLGQWQRILVAELDGPRSRSIRAMFMGTK